MSDNGGRVQDCHLEEAVRAEYRKGGAVCPLEGGSKTVPVSQFDHFIGILTQIQS